MRAAPPASRQVRCSRRGRTRPEESRSDARSTRRSGHRGSGSSRSLGGKEGGHRQVPPRYDQRPSAGANAGARAVVAARASSVCVRISTTSSFPSWTSTTTSSWGTSARAGTPIWSKWFVRDGVAEVHMAVDRDRGSASLAQGFRDCIRVRQIARVEGSCLGRHLLPRERWVVADPDDRVPVPAGRIGLSRRSDAACRVCDWLPGDAEAIPERRAP